MNAHQKHSLLSICVFLEKPVLTDQYVYVPILTYPDTETCYYLCMGGVFHQWPVQQAWRLPAFTHKDRAVEIARTYQGYYNEVQLAQTAKRPVPKYWKDGYVPPALDDLANLYMPGCIELPLLPTWN